jgi:hypothetical protein
VKNNACAEICVTASGMAKSVTYSDNLGNILCEERRQTVSFLPLAVDHLLF